MSDKSPASLTTTQSIRELVLPWPENWATAAARVAATERSAWLDRPGAAGTGAASGGWSYVSANPIAVLRHPVDGPAVFEVAGREVESDPNFWRLWKRASACLASPGDNPIGARWIGLLGFELADQIERLPPPRRDDVGLPLAWLGLYDMQIAIDAGRQRACAALDARAAEALGVSPAARQAAFEALLVRWCGTAAPTAAAPRPIVVTAPARGAHESAVRRALAYIAAGDIYQVNLARRLELEHARDALGMYLDARPTNPAAYRAFLRCDDGAAASFSPELMLEIRGRRVLTCPIKGTRPRGDDAAQDRARVAELLASAKDAAELAMIVDLHRNDLGRVCVPHSVRVEAARRVELHPSVIHTVADVRGELRDDCEPIDALAAAFPAGSISGVPKIRALEIIRELEPSPRGVYTGAIGWMDLAGNGCWSVAIRIVQFGRHRTVMHVGGGIVAESDPAAEYEETCHKARAILAGMGVEWTGAARAGHRV